MFIRLFPQDESALIDHELLRMGQAAAASTHRAQKRHIIAKLVGASPEIAAVFTAWLQTQTCWWYSTASNNTATVEVLFGGPACLLTTLSQTVQQTPSLQTVAVALQQAWHFQAQRPTSLALGAHDWELGQRPYVMGILNVTPDSFSDGGLYLQPEQALQRAETMLNEGADVLDVGGQSSRPGAVPVAAAVEQQRVVPVVREIVKRYHAVVSVDTYRASVAAAALEAGAVLVNDISALRFDAEMAPVIAKHGASVVLMHMQGTPQTMQCHPTYRHVLDDIYDFLAARLRWAMQAGIVRQRIMLDPGFGFGKTVQHNLDLLRGLKHFATLGQPLLVGTSRKSFLGRILRRQVSERLGGSLATAVYAALQGAAMIRVHDVGATVRAMRLLEAVQAPPPVAAE